MSDSNKYPQFTSLLDGDGPVALIIKQELAPDDEDDRVIYPPTYPLTSFKNRVQRFEHGEYRVSIELPPDTKRDKDERKDNQKPGYQIDRFPDGTNICEIDSIQSQSNRIEPLFKSLKAGKLVPQITVEVGKQTVNMLDAGHRAADAVIRMSQHAPEFFDAWQDAKSGDLYRLALLAPTTIVFGAWDSRSSQAKLQRLFKAYIRATNVLERTRSAQYTPAADYVALGAIKKETAELKDKDDLRLSKKGGVHALSTQTVGGVILTATSKLVRTVNINLAAIRQLRASGLKTQLDNNASDEAKAAARKNEFDTEKERTRLLQEYILGLTLVAANAHSSLNLREGCNLHVTKTSETKLVGDRRSTPNSIELNAAEGFAEHAAKAYFGTNYDTKDKHGIFEPGVAEAFLSLPGAERDEVRVLGPLTQRTLDEYAAKKKAKDAAGDPVEKLSKLVSKLSIGKTAKTKGQFNKKAFEELRLFTDELLANVVAGAEAKENATSIRNIIASNTSADEQLKALLDLFPKEGIDVSDERTTDSSMAEEDSK